MKYYGTFLIIELKFFKIRLLNIINFFNIKLMNFGTELMELYFKQIFSSGFSRMLRSKTRLRYY